MCCPIRKWISRCQHGSVLAANDNWQSTQLVAIQGTAIAPGNNLEEAIVTTLPAGAYTAVVSGKNGGSGVRLVEVYNLH
ncbi:MAG TPA: hypothetical protein VH207_10845 [Chthoniobacterales bacterium]|nr:hypothetical protein [Chthoniobacterales bacterium]